MSVRDLLPDSCEVCGRPHALRDYAEHGCGRQRGLLCTACGLLVRSLSHPDHRAKVVAALAYADRWADPLDAG